MKKQTSVFIVEDEMLIAACLRDQLEQAGYRISGSATRGDQCIQELRKLLEQKQEPDIVLMDINLRGELDGIETARRVVCEFDSAIIFLTGQSSHEVYERSFHIKPFGYILKPYDLEQMIMTIEIAVYQRNLEIENKQIRRKLEGLLNERQQENQEVLELYKSIIDNPLLACCIQQDDRISFANQALEYLTGLSREVLESSTISSLLHHIHPDDLAKLEELARQHLAGENPSQDTLFRILRQDGGQRWVKSFVKPILYKGKPALQHTWLDVTDQINSN